MLLFRCKNSKPFSVNRSQYLVKFVQLVIRNPRPFVMDEVVEGSQLPPDDSCRTLQLKMAFCPDGYRGLNSSNPEGTAKRPNSGWRLFLRFLKKGFLGFYYTSLIVNERFKRPRTISDGTQKPKKPIKNHKKHESFVN